MAQRKPAEERRVEIVMAALRLADVVGPDRLTTETIASAVGLTQPGVFRHFRTKQAIWQAVADTIADRMTDAWRNVLDRPGGQIDRLRDLVDAQLRLISATPAIPAILFSRELHVENDGLRKTFLALMKRYHRTIADEVRQAQDAGTVLGDLDADDVAFLLVGLVQGLAVRWSLSGRIFSLEDEGARLLAVQMALLRAESPARIAEESRI